MAVPKRRMSRSNTRHRRSQWKAKLPQIQKRVEKGSNPWLETTVVSTPNGTTSNALVAADLAHVAWAVNRGCLGFHVWPVRADDPGHTHSTTDPRWADLAGLLAGDEKQNETGSERAVATEEN